MYVYVFSCKIYLVYICQPQGYPIALLLVHCPGDYRVWFGSVMFVPRQFVIHVLDLVLVHMPAAAWWLKFGPVMLVPLISDTMLY